ncbi:MAG: DUF3786 domain-containing protein [Candidatus Helarchaeota archaeon]
MNDDNIEVKDLVSMRQFEGGWIWIKNIDEFSQKVVNALNKNYGKYNIKTIAGFLNGKVINFKIYNDTEWIIKIEPFPTTFLLIVYNENEEFGPEIKIFFNKTFLKMVPTEDAYVFIELYLRYLEYLIETPKIMEFKIMGDIISFDHILEISNVEDKEKIKHDILEIRSNIIEKISQNVIKNISKNLGAHFINGNWNNMEIDWGLSFSPLKDIIIYNVMNKDGYQVFFSSSILKLRARDVFFFTWLYCNAIIRESRKILGNKLPKLSKYL